MKKKEKNKKPSLPFNLDFHTVGQMQAFEYFLANTQLRIIKSSQQLRPLLLMAAGTPPAPFLWQWRASPVGVWKGKVKR